MSNLVSFAFEDNLVRSRLDENGEPWFVAKDAALALDYEWKGISTIGHVPVEWRRVYSVQPPRRSNDFLPPLDTSPRFRHPDFPN